MPQHINDELARLNKQMEDIKAAKAAKEAQQRFEFASKVKLVQYLENYLDAKIRVGQMTAEDFEQVFVKYKEVHQDSDDRLWFFVSTVIKLISHPWYGVECDSKYLANGGLKYKGQSYENPRKLYEAIMENIMGESILLDAPQDPFGADTWFYKLLQVHLEDSTELPAEVALGHKAQWLRVLKDFVMLERSPLEPPDASELTEDDMFYLCNLIGW